MSIILKNIVKYYNKGLENENKVLSEINLEIKNGEMVAIVGKSGAGKSTLLHIIGGIDTATDGTYTLDEACVNKMKSKQLAKLRNEKFGFVLQDFGLIEDESVISNTMLPMMFNQTSFETMKQVAKEKIEKVGMLELKNRYVGDLSGGEKQRVAIARALVNNPDYILADEPTGALDSVNTNAIINILQELNKIGKTVIIVTHDINLANQCKRIITMEDGRIKSDKEITVQP